MPATECMHSYICSWLCIQTFGWVLYGLITCFWLYLADCCKVIVSDPNAKYAKQQDSYPQHIYILFDDGHVFGTFWFYFGM